MNKQWPEEWETRIRQVARDFAYPPTPDLSSRIREGLRDGAAPARRSQPWRQKVAWAFVILFVVSTGLLAVREVRAAVLRALRLGAVEIVFEPTPTPARVAQTATSPTPTPLFSVLDLAGETTLSNARDQVDFTIRLPTYPAELGPPGRVFLQDLGGPVVVLVWFESGQLDRVEMSLHQLGPNTLAQKVQPSVLVETQVDGQEALWTEGPYLLQWRQEDRLVYDVRRLVAGHVLIWMRGEITYRLETDLPLEEAVRVAESLQ